MRKAGRIFLNFSIWTAKLDKIKNRKASDWLIVLLLGLLLLIAAIPDGAGKKSSFWGKGNGRTEKNTECAETESGNWDAYSSHLETRLENILEKMQGAGKVKVMITLKDEGEAVLGKDVKKNSESLEENTVLFDDADGTSPYVTKENAPEVMGVIVVAEGGSDTKTQARITEAVQAVLGIEVHKIRVLPMEKEKAS